MKELPRAITENGIHYTLHGDYYLLEVDPAPDKRTNQMGWVQHMSRLKAQEEEVILDELVYGI